MAKFFFQIGDKVMIHQIFLQGELNKSLLCHSNQYSREEWRTKPPVEEKEGRFIVVGFQEIFYGRNSREVKELNLKPGIYVDRDRVKIAPVRFSNEGVIVEYSTTLTRNSWDLILLDKKIEQKRINDTLLVRRKFHNQQDFEAFSKQRDFIRDLPETFFWEEDLVKLKDPLLPFWEGEEKKAIVVKDCFRVRRIEYFRLDEKLVVDPSGEAVDFHAYHIQSVHGIQLDVREGDIELVERGPIWEKAHSDSKMGDSFVQSCGLTTFHLV